MHPVFHNSRVHGLGCWTQKNACNEDLQSPEFLRPRSGYTSHKVS